MKKTGSHDPDFGPINCLLLGSVAEWSNALRWVTQSVHQCDGFLRVGSNSGPARIFEVCVQSSYFTHCQGWFSPGTPASSTRKKLARNKICADRSDVSALTGLCPTVVNQFELSFFFLSFPTRVPRHCYLDPLKFTYPVAEGCYLTLSNLLPIPGRWLLHPLKHT